MTSQDHKQALPPGFRLGSCRVVRVLGAGGFGVTYLCEHGGLGVTVAIKEYLPNDIAVRSGSAVAPKSTADREGYRWGLSRFLDEARTLARFEHRNVVRVRDYFEANGTAYIVMDYEDGEPLDRVLERKGTLTEAQIKRVLLPIVAGLRQVHAAGFLHRDVKPANIFIRRSDESPVLLDFGSARQALGRLSRSVTAIASSGYSPPEQYESGGEQGPWTDIYALSALCYRAITGMVPVEATRRQSRLLRGEDDPLPKLAEIAGGHCSRAFLEAVDGGLRLVDAERQGGLDEWWAELEGRTVGRATGSSGVAETSGRKRASYQGTSPRQAEPRGSAPDPEMMVRGMRVACFFIEGGVRKFGDYAKHMADELGETFSFYRPYLRQFYEGVRHDPNSTDWRGEMTPPVELDALESSGSMDMLLDDVAQNATECAAQAEREVATVQSEVGRRRRSGTALLLFGVAVSVTLYFAALDRLLVLGEAVDNGWRLQRFGELAEFDAGDRLDRLRETARQMTAVERESLKAHEVRAAEWAMTEEGEEVLRQVIALLDERFPRGEENFAQTLTRNMHDSARRLGELADSIPVSPDRDGVRGFVTQDFPYILGRLSAVLLSPGPFPIAAVAVGLLL